MEDSIGNMSHSYTEQTTTTSNISFTAEAGERIKFSFRSNVESGDLDIFLYDSAGIEVYKLDRAKELETFFNLPASGEYMLAAECGNFIGSFDIKVFEAD